MDEYQQAIKDSKMLFTIAEIKIWLIIVTFLIVTLWFLDKL